MTYVGQLVIFIIALNSNNLGDPVCIKCGVKE